MTPGCLLGPFKCLLLPGSVTRAICMCQGHGSSHNQSAPSWTLHPLSTHPFFLEFKRVLYRPVNIPFRNPSPLLEGAFLLGLAQSFSRPVVGEPRGRPRENGVNNSAHGVSFLQAAGWHCESMAPLRVTPCHSAFFLGSNIRFFSNISPWTQHDKALDSYCTNSSTQKRAQGC